MEYEELQYLWEKYDNTLDNLKKLDKQVMVRYILKQKQKRVRSLVNQNKSYLVFFVLMLISFAYSKISSTGHMDWKLLLGIIILLLSMLDYYLLVKKRNTILKKINLKTNTIIETVNALNQYPKSRFKNLRHLVIFYPVYLFGITLLMWDSIIIDDPNPNNKILFFLAIYLIGGLIGFPFYILEKRKINYLIKELNELKDEEL